MLGRQSLSLQFIVSIVWFTSLKVKPHANAGADPAQAHG
jgi:hypothetical protein